MISGKEFGKLIEQIAGSDKEALLKEILGSSAVLTRSTPAFQQIKKAQDIINNDGFDMSVYNDKPYLLTTRNQRYLDKTLPTGTESAFVILSAGDTLFELVSRDVSKIVTIDVSDLQPLIYKLRRASIMSLTPSEFEGFAVDSKGYRFMTPELYKKVRESFNGDVEALSFWDNIIRINPQEDLAQHLFKGVGGDVAKARYCLPYLKKKGNYFALRDKLAKAKISIELGEALTYLKDHPEQKFDYIDITNILLFLFQIQCEDDKERFNQVLKDVRSIYEANLNVGGVMVIDYLFGVGLKTLGNITIEDPDKRLVQEIYKYTYEKLRELFELESCTVEKLIDGFGNESDTILYVKK